MVARGSLQAGLAGAVTAVLLSAAVMVLTDAGAQSGGTASGPSAVTSTSPAFSTPPVLADIADRTWVLVSMKDIANRDVRLHGFAPIRLRISGDLLVLDSSLPATARVELGDFAGTPTLDVRELGTVSTAACVAPTPNDDNLLSTPCLVANELGILALSGPRLYLRDGELTLAGDDTSATFRAE